MRILCRMVSLWLCASCALIPEAYSSYPHTYLVNNRIKPNPTVRSKPTSLYPQYASVQFLQSDTNLTFNSDAIGVKAKCASLGYLIPVSQCSSPIMPSYLCSSELNEAGAEQYTNYCCNSNLYTVTNPDTCTDNATALPEGCYWGGSIKYRCACDRSRYPYSSLPGEGCGTNGNFNVNNMCRAPNASGEKISYYTSCCPTSYKECDGSKHLVGKGNSCRIESGGTIVNKYEYCECSSSYDTICGYDRLIRTGDEYVCTDDRGRWTRESNCESECSQTKETNIDQYLYGNVWHCLYKKDGATVKTTEGELCDGYNQMTEKLQADYYDECAAQGYIKSEADCYISDLILRCPNDTSKVWCLDSRYCTNFPAGEEACNAGARVGFCGSSDKGVRCSYNDDRCNKCWEDGVYKPTAPGCANYDSSIRGDSEVCCSRGYRMVNGICTKNVCNRTLFPYELNPGSDQGVLELCYEANPEATRGYDVYYGYSSCYGDAATGGMWKPADDNPRKCVCEREDDLCGWLPFDLSLYFSANSDTSENYTHVGFSQGAYGAQRSCTDSEGSYYGYSSCYIGSTMGEGAAKGMCLSNAFNAYTTYPYSNYRTQRLKYLNETITAAGFSSINEPARPISDSGQILKNNIYCINQNTHCPEGSCETGVKNMLINGCNNGWEEECSICYHIANLTSETVGSKTVYHWNKKFKLMVNSYQNATGIHLGFETCPAERPLGGIASVGYGNCFKRCSKDNLSSCAFGDIITDMTTNIDLGIVYYKSGNTLYVLATTPGNNKTYDQSITYASTYAPSGNTDIRFAAGKWELPDAAMISDTVLDEMSLNALNATYKYLNKTICVAYSWTKTESSSTGAYMRACCNTRTVYAKTVPLCAIPALKLTY